MKTKAIVLFLVLCLASFAYADIIYDWRIGEISSLIRVDDYGAIIYVDSAGISVSVNAFLPPDCTPAIGTLLRFRIRTTTWWSQGRSVIQFYPATGSTCFGMRKKMKFQTVRGKKEKFVIAEETITLISDVGADKKGSLALEKKWILTATDRGIIGDPATSKNIPTK